MIGGIGIPELTIILVIILIIFGVGKLPEIGGGIGKAIKNFKKATNEDIKNTTEDIKDTTNDNEKTINEKE